MGRCRQRTRTWRSFRPRSWKRRTEAFCFRTAPPDVCSAVSFATPLSSMRSTSPKHTAASDRDQPRLWGQDQVPIQQRALQADRGIKAGKYERPRGNGPRGSFLQENWPVSAGVSRAGRQGRYLPVLLPESAAPTTRDSCGGSLRGISPDQLQITVFTVFAWRER